MNKFIISIWKIRYLTKSFYAVGYSSDEAKEFISFAFNLPKQKLVAEWIRK